MRPGNRSTKKRKQVKVQEYVSIFENNQLQFDLNQYVAARLNKNVRLYLIGSN